LRKRRTDAKTRVAIRAFLANEVGAVETCQFLSSRMFLYAESLSTNDKYFVEEVADHLSRTLLRTEWHPDFAKSKLEDLDVYEAKIKDEVREICMKILATMEQRKLNSVHDEDS